MTLHKPSDNEEEYFARQEYERLRKLAQKQAEQDEAEELRQRKELHFMHCPKCGGDLAEIEFRKVKIDKCTMCEGIWLDAGELDQILAKEDANLVARILAAFK